MGKKPVKDLVSSYMTSLLAALHQTLNQSVTHSSTESLTHSLAGSLYALFACWLWHLHKFMLTWPALADYLHRHSASSLQPPFSGFRKNTEHNIRSDTKTITTTTWWGWQWVITLRCLHGNKRVISYGGSHKKKSPLKVLETMQYYISSIIAFKIPFWMTNELMVIASFFFLCTLPRHLFVYCPLIMLQTCRREPSEVLDGSRKSGS